MRWRQVSFVHSASLWDGRIDDGDWGWSELSHGGRAPQEECCAGGQVSSWGSRRITFLSSPLSPQPKGLASLHPRESPSVRLSEGKRSNLVCRSEDKPELGGPCQEAYKKRLPDWLGVVITLLPQDTPGQSSLCLVQAEPTCSSFIHSTNIY